MRRRLKHLLGVGLLFLVCGYKLWSVGHTQHNAVPNTRAIDKNTTAVAYLACDAQTAWVVCNAILKLRSTGYTGDVLILSPKPVLTETCHNAKLHVVDPVEYPDFLKRRASSANQRYCRYTKIRLWNLDYDRVVYLDWDTWVVRSIDNLLEVSLEKSDSVAAVRDTIGPIFNSGVMVLWPNRRTYKGLQKLARVHKSYNNGDQGVLNAYFLPDKIVWLPYALNVPAQLSKSAYWTHNKPQIIHYTGETKPWSWHKHKVSKWKDAPDDRLLAQWYAPFDAQKHETCSSFRFYRYPGFTCVITTFSRPLEMIQRVIDSVQHIEAIKEIRIKNSNPGRTIDGKFFVSGIPLSVDSYKDTSLNNRFDISKIQTEGVFYLDDDIILEREDIQYMLNMWSEHKTKLVGPFTRTHVNDTYTFNTRKAYSIMLTKALVISIDYVYKYDCLLHPQLKNYVTQQVNCEDILMNYLVASMTGEGPLFVAARPAVDLGRKTGLSVKDGSPSTAFKDARSVCMVYFSKLFGGNPLRYSHVYLKRNHYEKTIILSEVPE